MRQVLQCVTVIVKYDRKLLYCVTLITKCDKTLLQSVTVITECGKYYKVKRNNFLKHFQ